MNRPRVLSTTPYLIVSDLQRSLDFYTAKLGFANPMLAGEPPSFAMLDRDGFEVTLKVLPDPGAVRPNGPHGSWDMYVRVLDVESEMAALTAAGVAIDKGPSDTEYQMREIEVLDPDGYRWCFGQDVGGRGWTEAWEDALDVGSAKLRLVLKLAQSADGVWRGCLDSLDQNLMNLPIDTVSRDGSALRFEMKALGALYEGVLGESGTWSQRGRSWPLVLRRSP